MRHNFFQLTLSVHNAKKIIMKKPLNQTPLLARKCTGQFQTSLSANLKVIITHKSVKFICILMQKYPLSLDVSG